MKTGYVIAAGAALIFLLLFYWFQVRPTNIKSDCQRQADAFYAELATSEDTDGDGKIPRSSINAYEKRSDKYYESCLHLKGL